MTLTSVSYDSNAATTGFVTGYASPAVSAAVVFLFTSGSNNLFIYIPFTTGAISSNLNVDVVDLTSTSAPMNSLEGWAASGGSLSAFNFFDYTDYNQFYTQVIGSDTVLVSKFVYKVTAITAATSTQNAPASTLTGLTFTTATAAATGDKLCYAATSNGIVHFFLFSVSNPFQIELRDVVHFHRNLHLLAALPLLRHHHQGGLQRVETNRQHMVGLVPLLHLPPLPRVVLHKIVKANGDTHPVDHPGRLHRWNCIDAVPNRPGGAHLVGSYRTGCHHTLPLHLGQRLHA